MTDDQLLQIASEGGLTDEAAVALHGEMASRKLSSQAVSSYEADQRANERKQVEKSNQSGVFRLFGRRLISQHNTTHRVEIRTKWFALRGIPVFPVASYRYSCQQKTIGKATARHERLIDRVPLDWGQVLRTAAITYGLMILTLTLLGFIAEWQAKMHGR
jgi:hypothetical protein